VLSEDDGETAVVQDRTEPLGYKEQIPFHQTNWDSFGDGAEDAQARGLGDGFLAPALLLFRLDCAVGGGLWLAGVVS
jgi:hypothetical protein